MTDDTIFRIYIHSVTPSSVFPFSFSAPWRLEPPPVLLSLGLGVPRAWLLRLREAHRHGSSPCFYSLLNVFSLCFCLFSQRFITICIISYYWYRTISDWLWISGLWNFATTHYAVKYSFSHWTSSQLFFLFFETLFSFGHLSSQHKSSLILCHLIFKTSGIMSSL